MEVKVETKELLNELSIAMSVVETKSTLPILSNLFLSYKDKVLQIAASDLDVTYISEIPCIGEKEGAITIPAKSFSQIIRSFSDSEEVVLKLGDDRKFYVTPSKEKSVYILQTLPAEDFPRLMEPSGTNFTIPFDIFKSILKEALVSVGDNDSRHSVNGVLFIVDKEKIVAVSTDSFRLSYSVREYGFELENELRLLVPKKVLTEVLRLDGIEYLKVFVKDNQIFFSSNGRVLYSRLKDIKFPAFEKVIPTEIFITATIDREEFLKVLKRVLLIADVKTKVVSFDFKNDGNLTIESSSEEGNKGEEHLTCDSYEGSDIKLAFNGGFLVDFLNAVDDEKIVIKMKNAETQCIFEPLREDKSMIFKNIVMPIFRSE